MPLRPFIIENLWLKIFSLILAMLIWFAIQSTQSDYRFPQGLFGSRLQTLELSCPVTVMTPPTLHAGFALEPGTVLVKVRGEESVLKRLSPESLPAYVRLSEAPNPSRLVRVEVVAPRNVTIAEIVPDQVSVRAINSANK